MHTLTGGMMHALSNKLLHTQLLLPLLMEAQLGLCQGDFDEEVL